MSSTILFNPINDVILVGGVFVHKQHFFEAILVLDTGATYTMISWALARQLGIDTSVMSVRKTVPFYSASGHVEAPLVKIDQFRVKKTVAKKLDVLVHDLPQGTGVDGLLGLNFLRQFQVKLDFKKGKLSLS